MNDHSQFEESEATTVGALETSVFIVRFGSNHVVGSFMSTDGQQYRRGSRVLCRSARGLEAGTVLGLVRHSQSNPNATVGGTIVRRMSPEDELLLQQMIKLSQQASEECCRWLADHQVDATLLDVEPLMDGQTLYFHFLSDVGPEVQQHLDQLVMLYQESVASSRFARLLEHGCGPGCGTERAQNSCNSHGGCAICQVASACKKSNRETN